VEPHSGAGCVDRIELGGEHRADRAGEDVAGTGGGEPVAGPLRDADAAVGRGDDGVGAFEDDDRVGAGGGVAGSGNLVGIGFAEERVELACMGGEDDGDRQRLDPLGVYQAERVAVDDQRVVRGQCCFEAGLGEVVAAETGADHECADAVVGERVVGEWRADERVRGALAVSE